MPRIDSNQKYGKRTKKYYRHAGRSRKNQLEINDLASTCRNEETSRDD